MEDIVKRISNPLKRSYRENFYKEIDKLANKMNLIHNITKNHQFDRIDRIIAYIFENLERKSKILLEIYLLKEERKIWAKTILE